MILINCMTHSELLLLRNKAKSKVRKMVNNWINNDLDIKTTMITVSNALIEGTLEKEDVDSAFKRRLMLYIADNVGKGDNIIKSAIFFELLQKVFLEEAKTMQN